MDAGSQARTYRRGVLRDRDRDRPPANTPASSRVDRGRASSRCSRAGSPRRSPTPPPNAVCAIIGGDCDAGDGGEDARRAGADRGPRAGRLRPAVPGAAVPGLDVGLLHLLDLEPGRLPGRRGPRRVRRRRGHVRDRALGHHARRRGLPDADAVGDRAAWSCRPRSPARRPSPPASLSSYLGEATTYSVTVPPDAADAIENGDRSVPNPIDPRTIQRRRVGRALAGVLRGHTARRRSYRALQLELGYEEGKRVSAGVSRVNPDTLRVYVGDEDFVRNALSLGIGNDAAGVALAAGSELSDGKLRSVDIDISTAAGWKAYQSFLKSGRLPTRRRGRARATRPAPTCSSSPTSTQARGPPRQPQRSAACSPSRARPASRPRTPTAASTAPSSRTSTTRASPSPPTPSPAASPSRPATRCCSRTSPTARSTPTST